MEAWDDVSSALLHFLEPGQENATVLSDTLSQVLKKDTVARLSSDPVTIPGSGNSTGTTFVKLPPLGSSESDVMGVQVSSARRFSCVYKVLNYVVSFHFITAQHQQADDFGRWERLLRVLFVCFIALVKHIFYSIHVDNNYDI